MGGRRDGPRAPASGGALLSASIRLSADRKARDLFGTSWTGWIDYIAGLLVAAKEQGELLPHVDPHQAATLFVSSWTGVEIVATSLENDQTLEARIAVLYDYFLPSVAVPGALRRLDTAPDRGGRVWQAHHEHYGQERAAEPDGVLSSRA
ncbi:TetR family transcriptional regulator C-terminal domain-containing protein [Streptomyces stramineus]